MPSQSINHKYLHEHACPGCQVVRRCHVDTHLIDTITIKAPLQGYSVDSAMISHLAYFRPGGYARHCYHCKKGVKAPIDYSFGNKLAAKDQLLKAAQFFLPPREVLGALHKLSEVNREAITMLMKPDHKHEPGNLYGRCTTCNLPHGFADWLARTASDQAMPQSTFVSMLQSLMRIADIKP